MVGENAVMSN